MLKNHNLVLCLIVLMGAFAVGQVDYNSEIQTIFNSPNGLGTSTSVSPQSKLAATGGQLKGQ